MGIAQMSGLKAFYIVLSILYFNIDYLVTLSFT